MALINDLGIVIVAGGSSSRFGNEDKLLIEIEGVPVIAHSIKAFLGLIPSKNIVIVTSKGRETELQEIIQKHLDLQVKTVTGGNNRSDSSLNGLLAIKDLTYAAVHDAARPFIIEETIKNCLMS